MRQKDFTIFFWALTVKYFSLTLYCLVSIKLIWYIGLLVNVAIVLFCLRFLKYSSPQLFIALLYGLFIIGLTLWGVYNQNWVKYIVGDILVWGLAIVILIGGQDSNDRLTSDFPRWVGAWMVVGVPMSWFLMFKFGFSPGNFLFGERFAYSGDLYGQAYGLFVPIQPVYASIYVAPFFSELKGIRRLAVCLGIGTVLIFGLFTLTRQFIVVPLVAFSSILIVQRKIVGKVTLQRLAYMIFLVAFFVSMWVVVYGADTLQTTKKSLIERMISSQWTRNMELEIYWEAQSPVHKVVGRGMGGSNTTFRWTHLPYGVAMLHYGIGHVLLKGGIIFFLFIYSVTIWAFCKLWRYPDKHCWFWVLLIFTITCFAHTEWGYFFPVIFFWLSISQAASCGKTPIRRKIG